MGFRKFLKALREFFRNNSLECYLNITPESYFENNLRIIRRSLFWNGVQKCVWGTSFESFVQMMKKKICLSWFWTSGCLHSCFVIFYSSQLWMYLQWSFRSVMKSLWKILLWLNFMFKHFVLGTHANIWRVQIKIHPVALRVWIVGNIYIYDAPAHWSSKI